MLDWLRVLVMIMGAAMILLPADAGDVDLRVCMVLGAIALGLTLHAAFYLLDVTF